MARKHGNNLIEESPGARWAASKFNNEKRWRRRQRQRRAQTASPDRPAQLAGGRAASRVGCPWQVRGRMGGSPVRRLTEQSKFCPPSPEGCCSPAEGRRSPGVTAAFLSPLRPLEFGAGVPRPGKCQEARQEGGLMGAAEAQGAPVLPKKGQLETITPAKRLGLAFQQQPLWAGLLPPAKLETLPVLHASAARQQRT